jgi:hypothetical protein
MVSTGVLETMARVDLDVLVETISRHYTPGRLEQLGQADPAWRAALDRAESEVGRLYGALCEADLALARWRQAVAELHRLWARVLLAPAGEGASGLPVLEEVA